MKFFKKLFTQKIFSLITSLSLILNSLQPFVFLLTPSISKASANIESKIEYYNNTYNIKINNADAGVSGNLDYLLAYKTDKQIEAVTGSDVDLDKNTNFSKEIYAGTCSENGKVCVPHQVLRGILKTKINSAHYLKAQGFNISDGQLSIVFEKDANQLELTDLENYWLENGSFEIEQVCDDKNVRTSTNDDWNINIKDKIAETKQKVELGITYVFPLEEKVTIRFTCLPKDENLRSTLKIRQIKIGDLKLPDKVKPSGEYAYDITTQMEDGSFKYEITLPKPENQEAKVSYIEKSVEEIKDQAVKEEEIKSPEESKITQGSDQVKVTDLDHFTIYFVESDYTTIKVEPVSYLQGETVYLKADGLNSSKYYQFYLDPPGVSREFPIGSCQSGSATTITESYTLSTSAAIGEWKVELYRFDNSGCNSGKHSEDEKRFTVNQPKADLVVSKTNNAGGITKIGQVFKWTLRVTNQGTARADFGKNETILIDNLPDSGVTYSSPVVENVTNVSQVGGINCSISAAKDLTCKTGNAGGNYVYIEVDGYFDVSIDVTPSASTLLENPRGGRGGDKCQVDPDNKVSESQDNNNNCSDSVFVTLADGNCNICANGGKPDWLVLRLETNSGQVKVKLGDKAGDPVIFNQWVSQDSTFTINGDKADGTFSKNDLYFYKNDTLVGKIHVSCSKDIISGQTTDESHGNVNGEVDFTVIQAHNKDSNLTCPISTPTPTPTETPTPTPTETPTPTPSPYCGDGVKNGNEDCDGIDGVTPGKNFCTARCKLVPIYDGEHQCPAGTVKSQSPVWTGSISSTDPDGETFDLTSGGKYLFEASGTFRPTSPSGWYADAGYTTSNNWSSLATQYGIHGTGNDYAAHALLADLGSGVGVVDWGDYNSDHIYTKYYSPTKSNVQFVIGDRYGDWFNTSWQNQAGMSDNDGSLTLNVYECQEYGSISGYKYEDINGNGSRDENENNLLPDWTIKLKQGDNEIDSKTTGADGTYSFSNVVPGDYQVCEVLSEGWMATDPSEGNCKNVTVGAGEDIQVNFGNFKLGKIQGRKYEDLNNDGSYNTGEPYLNDWTIRLYKKDGGSWDLIESKSTGHTGTVGQYRFEGLTLGQYKICEVLKDGWKQTAPTGSANRQQPDEAPRCRTTSITQSGQVRSGISFGNIHFGSISGYKYEDINGNGQEDEGEISRLANWTIKLKQGDTEIDSTTTKEDGTYSFANVIPGNYQVCEILSEGWIATDPAEGNCKNITIGAGQDMQVNFGNFKLGKVTVTKFNDQNQDGIKDNNEEVLAGWTVNLASDSGTLTQNTASPSGQAVFDGLLAGNYTLSENLAEGWKQTNIYCDEYDGNYQDNTYSLTISSGADLNCYIANHQLPPPTLSIAKSNNVYPSTTAPGSVVTFTLKLKVSDNKIYNVFIKDILPPGFVFNDVWSATVNEAPVSLPHPHYASPGTWQLGDLNEGDEVVINYQAKVKDTAEPGLYKDLAWAVGNQTDDPSSTKVLALATDSGSTDPGIVSENFVGTKVSVNKDVQNYTSADIKKEEVKEEQGEVLGASTSLPATGGKIIWIVIATLFTLLGGLLIFLGLFEKKLNLKKIASLFLALILYALMTQNALAGSLSVRLSEPKSPTRFNTFDLSFVALDLNNNPITVDCYYKKDGGVYTHFDITKSLTPGGNVGNCHVTSSQINEDGKTYYFYVTASNGTETINSEIVSVDFNTQGPGTPTNYSKDKTGTCQYKIKFKTADDGGKTVKVEVYRSKETSFSLDSGTRVATIPIGSNTDYTYIDNIAADCEKDWYYALRAFDNYGNGSGWVGDSIVTVTTTATTTTTAGETAPTSGAIPVANVTLPVAETTGAPEVLGEKTTTSEAKPTQKEEKKTVKSIGEILGETVKKENKYKILFAGLGIVLLAIIGYAIYKKNKSKIKDQISK